MGRDARWEVAQPQAGSVRRVGLRHDLRGSHSAKEPGPRWGSLLAGGFRGAPGPTASPPGPRPSQGRRSLPSNPELPWLGVRLPGCILVRALVVGRTDGRTELPLQRLEEWGEVGWSEGGRSWKTGPRSQLACGLREPASLDLPSPHHPPQLLFLFCLFLFFKKLNHFYVSITVDMQYYISSDVHPSDYTLYNRVIIPLPPLPRHRPELDHH